MVLASVCRLAEVCATRKSSRKFENPRQGRFITLGMRDCAPRGCAPDDEAVCLIAAWHAASFRDASSSLHEVPSIWFLELTEALGYRSLRRRSGGIVEQVLSTSMVSLNRLDLTVANCRMAWLINLLTRLFSGTIRTYVCRALQAELDGHASDLLRGVNGEMRGIARGWNFGCVRDGCIGGISPCPCFPIDSRRIHFRRNWPEIRAHVSYRISVLLQISPGMYYPF